MKSEASQASEKRWEIILVIGAGLIVAGLMAFWFGALVAELSIAPDSWPGK